MLTKGPRKIPETCQRILREAKQKYQQTPAQQRPCLAQPTSCLGLFSPVELYELARAQLWPLPLKTLAWIAANEKEEERK